MCDIQALVEAYLITERDLVAAVDAAGGAVLLTDGRTVSTGRPSSTLCSAGAAGWPGS